jgi:hypothetical protein
MDERTTHLGCRGLLRIRSKLCSVNRMRSMPAHAGNLWSELCKLSVRLQGGPRTGPHAPPTRRLALTPLLMRRQQDQADAGRAGAKTSKSGGAARRGRPVLGPSWPRPCRWPVPDLRGDPARGLTTGHCGQARAARPPVQATRPRPHAIPEPASSSMRGSHSKLRGQDRSP